jgi:ABC-type multidrug transport system fused ATPase/permease subunit
MRAIGAGARVFEVLDRQPLIPLHSGIALSPERRGTIKFDHVHFEYPTRKDVKILKDFNLEVKVGETVAIV